MIALLQSPTDRLTAFAHAWQAALALALNSAAAAAQGEHGLAEGFFLRLYSGVGGLINYQRVAYWRAGHPVFLVEATWQNDWPNLGLKALSDAYPRTTPKGPPQTSADASPRTAPTTAFNHHNNHPNCLSRL
jgi:hypothetical protein